MMSSRVLWAVTMGYRPSVVQFKNWMGKRGGRGGVRGTGRGGGVGDDGGPSGLSDQYGDLMRSQDRDIGHSVPHRSGGGGGSAGGGGARGPNLSFQRQMPKFLQQYSHLLGGGRGGRGHGDDEDERTVNNEDVSRKRPRDDDNEEVNENVEAEALKRAMLENPALAAEFEATLNKRILESEAEQEKERGNALFKAGKFAEAAECFSLCIEKSPSANTEIYYSNRSACWCSLEQWTKALEDAKMAVKIKPGWAKAQSRLGQAFMGLQLYSEAREAFERAAKIEPDNSTIQKSLQQAMMREMQDAQANKHMFKSKSMLGSHAPSSSSEGQGKASKGKPTSEPQKKKALLSFDDEEEG
jgi:tetratricopeptide (TPR) repeat protein